MYIYIYSTIWYDPKYCLMIHIYLPVNPRESRSSLITSWNDRGFWIEHCSVVRPMTHFLAMFFFLWKGDDSVNVWSVYQNTRHAIFFHMWEIPCVVTLFYHGLSMLWVNDPPPDPSRSWGMLVAQKTHQVRKVHPWVSWRVESQRGFFKRLAILESGAFWKTHGEKPWRSMDTN